MRFQGILWGRRASACGIWGGRVNDAVIMTVERRKEPKAESWLPFWRKQCANFFCVHQNKVVNLSDFWDVQLEATEDQEFADRTD